MAEYRVRLWLVLLKEMKAKTAVRIRRVQLKERKDSRVLGSTLVGDFKGMKGKDSRSTPPSGDGGWQSTGFDSA